MERRTHFISCAIALLLAMSAGAGAARAADTQAEAAVQATWEIPEENLLDVGITVFDPGIPPDEAEYELQEEGIFLDIRKAESRFFPVHLMQTLQATGQWGAVRVMPSGSGSAEVVVSGAIVESTGQKLVLDISVHDVSGREWLSKRYKEIADVRAYRGDDLAPPDPYQSLYNRVVNDMLVARGRLDEEKLVELRRIATLRFASELAPEAFADFLKRKRRGRWTVDRLPAEGDPMVARVERIRERDHMFIDILNEHYANHYAQMEEPYDNWRSFSYEEQVALQELRRAARLRKILGAVAILGGVMVEGAPAGTRDIAIIGGMAAISSGINKGQEANIHREGLRELGQSFDAEIAPMVLEVEGQVLRLSGSAETQYETWRDLLQKVWDVETGRSTDPNSGPVIAADGSILN